MAFIRSFIAIRFVTMLLPSPAACLILSILARAALAAKRPVRFRNRQVLEEEEAVAFVNVTTASVGSPTTTEGLVLATGSPSLLNVTAGGRFVNNPAVATPVFVQPVLQPQVIQNVQNNVVNNVVVLQPPTVIVVQQVSQFVFQSALGGLVPAVILAPPQQQVNVATFTVLSRKFATFGQAASFACTQQSVSCRAVAGPSFSIADCQAQLRGCLIVAQQQAQQIQVVNAAVVQAPPPVTVTQTVFLPPAATESPAAVQAYVAAQGAAVVTTLVPPPGTVPSVVTESGGGVKIVMTTATATAAEETTAAAAAEATTPPPPFPETVVTAAEATSTAIFSPPPLQPEVNNVVAAPAAPIETVTVTVASVSTTCPPELQTATVTVAEQQQQIEGQIQQNAFGVATVVQTRVETVVAVRTVVRTALVPVAAVTVTSTLIVAPQQFQLATVTLTSLVSLPTQALVVAQQQAFECQVQVQQLQLQVQQAQQVVQQPQVVTVTVTSVVDGGVAAPTGGVLAPPPPLGTGLPVEGLPAEGQLQQKGKGKGKKAKAVLGNPDMARRQAVGPEGRLPKRRLSQPKL